MLRYKIVETSIVTDEELERIVNEWTEKGWELDRFEFVTHDGSRRPAMAFVMFTSPSEDDYEEEDEDDGEAPQGEPAAN